MSETMKAAVMYQKGGMPRYVDFPEPTVQNSDELLITMKAAAIKHLDRSRASGQHYSSDADQEEAKVIGGDGVGILADGTRVYALGASGMLAERAVIEKGRMVRLPNGIDDATAAALPNAVIGSAMGLRFRAKFQSGETVLVNGATGFTGRVAVQIAKHYGAQKVIATGRNVESLKTLVELGADEVILLQEDDEKFINQIKEIHSRTPIDVVIDYLWGHTAEMILAALKGKGSFTHRVRFVSVGGMAGDKIQLSSAILRSSDLQLSGSGLGSWKKEEVQKLFTEILPESFQLAVDGKLRIETLKVSLKEIETIWNAEIPNGQRLVVMI